MEHVTARSTSRLRILGHGGVEIHRLLQLIVEPQKLSSRLHGLRCRGAVFDDFGDEADCGVR